MYDNEPFMVGDWRVDPEADRITSGSVSKTLRRQVMEILVYLAKHQGRVVSADDLLDDLWAGKVVTSGNVYNVIAELRQQLAGADGDVVDYIETIPKKGYRLVADVSKVVDARESSARSDETSGGIIEQLRRRNVTRVGLAYLAVSWFILQVLETLASLGVLQESIGRYVFFTLLIGFPVALLMSWKYEFTADGLKSASDVGVLVRTAPFGGRRIDLLIIGSLSLVIVLLVLDNYVLNQSIAEPTGNRIAVLPFVNLSGSDEQEYFSDGIADDLATKLGRNPDLLVLARTSSFSFKGSNSTVSEIADLLDADFVLEGTVRMLGAQLRVFASLAETGSGVSLWSNTYDRTVDDALKIQDEISAAIVAAIGERIDLDVKAKSEPVATGNADAYAAYLRGRNANAQWKPIRIETAVKEFERAIELDPGFALAYAELADALARPGCDRLLGRDCSAESAQHAETALELNPNLAEAYLAKSYQYRGEEALDLLHRAVEINPSHAGAWERMVHVLLRLSGRHQERFNAIETALSINPLSVPGNWEYVFSLIERGMLDEAEIEIEKFSSIDPSGAKVMRAYLTFLGGRTGEFLLAYLEAADNEPDSLIHGQLLFFDLMFHLNVLGLEDEAIRIARERQNVEALSWSAGPEEGLKLANQLRQQDPDAVGDWMMGMVHAHAGHYEEARELLEPIWVESLNKRLARNDFYSAYLGEALVAIYRSAGDAAAAEEVLHAMEDVVLEFRAAGIVVTQQYYSTDYMEGIAAYLAGDRQKALYLIAKAAEEGFAIPQVSAFQEERYQDADFALILQKQAERQARQRDELLSVVCIDNPSPSIWTPLPETCAPYLVPGKDDAGPSSTRN